MSSKKLYFDSFCSVCGKVTLHQVDDDFDEGATVEVCKECGSEKYYKIPERNEKRWWK